MNYELIKTNDGAYYCIIGDAKHFVGQGTVSTYLLRTVLTTYGAPTDGLCKLREGF